MEKVLSDILLQKRVKKCRIPINCPNELSAVKKERLFRCISEEYLWVIPVNRRVVLCISCSYVWCYTIYTKSAFCKCAREKNQILENFENHGYYLESPGEGETTLKAIPAKFWAFWNFRKSIYYHFILWKFYPLWVSAKLTLQKKNV